MFLDLIYDALSKSNTVEHITITTTDANAKAGNFSTLTSSTVKDLLIQNTTANACYVTFGTSAVTATTSHAYLAANASISLEACQFTYFSVIRAAAGDVTIRITGIGRV